MPPYLRAGKSQNLPTGDLQVAITSLVAGSLFLGLLMKIVTVTFYDDLDLLFGNALDDDGEVHSMLADQILRRDHDVSRRLMAGEHCRVPDLSGTGFVGVTDPDERGQQKKFYGTLTEFGRSVIKL